jgi:hypothetical protein
LFENRHSNDQKERYINSNDVHAQTPPEAPLQYQMPSEVIVDPSYFAKFTAQGMGRQFSIL